ncbi:MAG: hypothetical protein KDJ37_00255 [Hyphomicrobiaceae bacterium]|nr:hypothetical protein [Hyphomicrobiaceae bacterium]
MMDRYARRWAAGLVLMLALLIGSGGSALAACAGNANNIVVTVTPSPVLPGYDPFAAGDLVRTITVTITNNTNRRCDAAISFQRSGSASPAMTSGGNGLNYVIEESTGGSSLVTTAGFISGSSPAAANRVAFGNVTSGSSASRTLQVRIPAGQVVAAGDYIDGLVSMQVIGLNNAGTNPIRLVKAVAFVPQATVVAKCIMPSPSTPNLNFSAAIANGRPNSGVVQTTTFSNVACTAPARLRLTGAALQPTSPIPARAGFDNFINYRADGSFGSAAATLSTTVAEHSVDSAQKNTASGATSNGFISVGVNLISGNPIIAGSYTGILTVTIDPAL